MRGAVVGLERLLDDVGVVREVEHHDVVLLRVRAVEPRERLHGLDAGQRLVDVHRVQQRLVVAGLELVGADQEAVRVLLDLVGDLAAREAVELGLGDLLAVVLGLAGEGDDVPVRALALLEVVPDREVVLDARARYCW